jgi:hypothetical protein
MTTERRRSSTPFAVTAVSGGIFLAVFAGLADRARRGADPAIGAPKPAAQEPPKRVLVRRIVRRVIVTDAAGAGTPAAAAPSGSSAPAASSSPVTTSAPAPAPVAAPAPAPAPVTSSS